MARAEITRERNSKGVELYVVRELKDQHGGAPRRDFRASFLEKYEARVYCANNLLRWTDRTGED